MAISKTDICNKALTLVGANPIVNIDDEANNARILNRVYDISLRSILSECLWNFATKRSLLALSADTVEWYHTNESYIYAKPADCVKIFSSNDNDAEWREEGDYILSDTSGLGIKYVRYLDEPNKYPAPFAEAFIDKLAAEIAFTVVNSRTLGVDLTKKYLDYSLPRAKSENAQTGTHQYVKDDAWELAKFSNDHPDA